MPDCTVTCRKCRTDKNEPQVWRWLCEECATECAEQHRKDTGHRVELNVTEQPTTEKLRMTCQVAAMIRHRERFW
jgi:hypothetical protein